MPLASITALNNASSKITITLPTAALCLSLLSLSSYGHADNMSALIAQKSAQTELPAPAARISTRSSISIQRAAAPSSNPTYSSTTARATPVISYRPQQPVVSSATVTTSTNIRPTYTAPAVNPSFSTNNNYRYPQVSAQPPAVLPAFLSGSYDNVDSEYLPLLSNAEAQSSRAARGVISTARTMALNERTIIQGGCWDYLNAVFKRAGVSRDTLHKGTYRQGPYANSSDIEIGDWLYYINHGYNGVEHSGLFVGWVDESAKQALILSYAGENRREPARYRVYDLSNVYQIMRPTI